MLTINEKLEAFMASNKAGKSEMGMRQLDRFREGKPKGLQKDRVELGQKGKRIYAIELVLPFNPKDLQDESYNSSNPFIMPGSPTTAVIMLKRWAREDKNLHQVLSVMAGLDGTEYDVSEDALTAQDESTFKKYRRIVHYSAYVQHGRMSGFGQWGRKFLSNVRYDEAGRPTVKDTGYKMYELERSLANVKLAKLDAEVADPTSDKYNMPQKALKEERKKIFQAMAISEPYMLGTIRALIIEMDDDYKPKADLDLKSDLVKYDRYASGNLTDTNKLDGTIGKPTDRNFDFIEVDIEYPIVNGNSDNEKKFKAYQERTVNYNPVVQIKDTNPEFVESYRKYRDDVDNFAEKKMLASVFDYGKVEDDLLIQHYNADLGSREGLITEAIEATHAQLLETLGRTVSTTDLQIEHTEKEEHTQLFKTEGKVTENTPGAGLNPEEQINELDLMLGDE